MTVQFTRFGAVFLAAALPLFAGCGGGSDSTAPAAAAAATTTNVSTTVIDGAIKNALVCLDKNANGKCDADEVQGKTDAAGNVTLAIPNADVGKYPLLAVIDPADAVDADTGPVTVRYTLSAPADQVGVVSPLTTLVQQTVASTASTTAEAAKSVQDATGITASLFQDFTKSPAPTDGSINPATVARMVVVTTQQQASAIAGTLGTMAIDNVAITQADLDKAVQRKLLELLPNLVAALGDPAVLAATTPATREAALRAAATTLITTSGLTPAAVATVVAINTQNTTPPVVVAAAPSAFVQLHALNFTSVANHFVRVFTGSLAQNTPDTANTIRYVDRRTQAINGNVAKWGTGANPAGNADLHWNGTGWVGCPINTANPASVRDAQGNSVYGYCNGYETGKSNRATFDIGGRAMSDVYAQVRTAGYTNLTIADTAALGSAVFPAGSALFYQTSTPLTNAPSYYPGSANPVGVSNVVSQYSPAVSAGGTASAQAAGANCNAAETNTNGSNSTTLEGMVAAMTGTPCIYGQASFVYAGVTYTSNVPNEWWGNSTASIGVIGSVPLNSGTVAPGFYSGNTKIRIAFQGTGANPVTYYACKERFTNGSTRACVPIGTGSYTITTLGDARVMTLGAAPAQAAPLTYQRVFVERGGFVYYGYRNKPNPSNTARLNTTATGALLTQLGLPVEDPSVPFALTAGSYRGTWDVRDPIGLANNGTTVFINGNGSVSCQDRSNASFFACTLTITDAATGAFSFRDLVDNTTAIGSFDFMAGTAAGTYNDPTATPMDGTFVGHRR